MKITGSKAQVFIDSFNDTSIVNGTGTNTTEARQKYFVIDKAEESNIPVVKGTFFIAPQIGGSANQIMLKEGDRLFKINEERFCKTNASFEFSFGSVDVGDDCDPGATISDGILSLTGSLAGLFRYDDETQDFDCVTDIIVNRFLDIVEDKGDGQYELFPRTDNQIYLLTLLNSGGKAGQTENWLFAPININSMSMSLGNTDAQNKDLSFSKGEGKPIIYKIPVAA
ncbi:MAG: hypothetical protein FWD14_01930 [Treponema sp.]|nr:hypothetical protein [Treponema sp.]